MWSLSNISVILQMLQIIILCWGGCLSCQTLSKAHAICVLPHQHRVAVPLTLLKVHAGTHAHHLTYALDHGWTEPWGPSYHKEEEECTETCPTLITPPSDPRSSLTGKLPHPDRERDKLKTEEEEEIGSQSHLPAAKDPCLKLYIWRGVGPQGACSLLTTLTPGSPQASSSSCLWP